MKVHMSFKNVKHSSDVEEKINQKSEGFEKYLKGKIDVHWTCYESNGMSHTEVKLLGPHIDLHAHAFHQNLYKCFDNAAQKIEKQLKKQKDIWKDHHKRKSVKEIESLEPEVAWQNYDEDQFDDVKKA